MSVTPATLGGVPAAEITTGATRPRHVILYFHSGVYVLGDASGAAGLAAQVGQQAAARVLPADYRLAPDHALPLPAAACLMSPYADLTRAGTTMDTKATADVQVTHDITPGVPHVFQTFYPILDEAAAALDRAGQFLTTHLTSTEHATA